MRKILIASIFIFTFCAFAFGQNSNCPPISVIGPSNLSAIIDGNMDFAAEVSGIDVNKIGYKWTVSENRQFQGQGTNKIRVDVKELYDNAIKATVEISNLPEGCPNTDSETGVVIFHFISQLADETNNSSKVNYENIDAIINELKSKPDWQLYLISYPDRKGSEKKANEKLNQITKYLSKRGIASDRIVILKDDDEEDKIQIWLVPPGTEPPTP